MAESNLIFHPGASEDYEAAFAWYHSRGIGVALDFEREIDRAVRLIARDPLRWPNFDETKRRFVVWKFPYSVVYELINNDIVILAVAHGRRKPDYWITRSG